MAAGSPTSATSTLLTTGMRGLAKATSARRPARRSAAGLSSDEWNGALTGSMTARLAPSRLAPRGALDRRLVAGDHDLARCVEVDRLDHFALRALGTRGAHLVVVEAEQRGHRTGADGHGFLHGLRAEAHEGTASRNAITPAATSAVYSPRLCPATSAGSGPPASCQHGTSRTRP